MTYKIEIAQTDAYKGVISKKENGSKKSFMTDPDNTDYQEYLAWLAEGNEPLPADEPPAT